MPRYYLAPSLYNLRAEINVAHPNRDKASDGWIGDASHRARKSDHNPDYSAGGVVRAIDIDKDGIDTGRLLHILVHDPRVNYVIWDSHIYSRTYGFRKRYYTGSNKHTLHMHVSINHGGHFENDTRPWGYTYVAPPPPPPAREGDLVFPNVKLGDSGQMVRNLQGLLVAAGRSIEVDGDFGPRTEAVLREYQTAARIGVDGVAGTQTFRTLLGV